MSLDIAAVRRALRDDGLDGWLLYDFHGSNPIARRVAGLNAAAKLTTRRWYYLIPVDGAPRGLVHAIERDRLDHLPGDKTRYARHSELDAGLTRAADRMRERGHGVFARVRHPLRVTRRRRHRRRDSLARRRGALIR